MLEVKKHVCKIHMHSATVMGSFDKISVIEFYVVLVVLFFCFLNQANSFLLLLLQ